MADLEEKSGKYTAADLHMMYSEGETANKDIFSEMRTAALLAIGEHYTKKDSAFYRRVRDSKDLSKEAKLRITKNHIRKILQIYANNIMSPNPGVGFMPKDEQSTHDIKSAKLHHSVWRSIYEQNSLNKKIESWVDSFCTLGEEFVKVFFDPNAGPIVAYGQKVDEFEQPMFDEVGQPVPDMEKPIAEGRMMFEELYAFNLITPNGCRDLDSAEWLCYRKVMDVKTLKKMYPDVKDKISEGADETVVVFDTANGGYSNVKGQVTLKEWYFRPGMQFPKGYYYIALDDQILEEGELPGGIFPIAYVGFDKLQTSCRHRSPVKTMRPYQAEINRAASKMAEHQVTLGDDKLLIQNGQKVSAGASLPGVRTISYNGAEPKVMPGRDGSQYLSTIQQNITELYQVMSIQEDSAVAQNTMDPYSLLFQAAKNKKYFKRYISKIENFLIDIVKITLNLSKIHLDDDAVVYAVGSAERVNIPEFRQYADTSFDIKIEAQSEDVESKLGKQLVLNHMIQYIGPQLQKDDIGKLLRQSPYAEFDSSFDDLTMDYDSAENDILALDRGETPPVNQYDEHKYMVRKLSVRMRKSDFKFLPPEVQNNYQQKIKLHQEFIARQVQEAQRIEQGFIPTGGALVNVDIFTNEPNASGKGFKTTKMKVPYESLQWLVKQIELQGSTQAMLQSIGSGNAEQVASMIPPAQPEMGMQQMAGQF